MSHAVHRGPLVVFACAALARDLRAVIGAGGLADAIEVELLPSSLHNTPAVIPDALRPRLSAAVAAGRRAFVAYADCGTGGRLDALLADFPGVQRLPGAHCYELFAGAARFAALHDAEPGTFYLTDYLARHFDALVWAGLGLDRHPQLRDTYFAHYTRVVYLAQHHDAELRDRAAAAAARLGLPLMIEPTGRSELSVAIETWSEPVGTPR